MDYLVRVTPDERSAFLRAFVLGHVVGGPQGVALYDKFMNAGPAPEAVPVIPADVPTAPTLPGDVSADADRRLRDTLDILNPGR